MESKYKTALQNRTKNGLTEAQFIRACLADIKGMLAKQPLHRLDFGNTTLKFTSNPKGEESIFMAINAGIRNEGFFELYGEDGYTSAEDIAHWADVVTDVINCYKAGNKEYTQTWNLK